MIISIELSIFNRRRPLKSAAGAMTVVRMEAGEWAGLESGEWAGLVSKYPQMSQKGLGLPIYEIKPTFYGI